MISMYNFRTIKWILWENCVQSFHRGIGQLLLLNYLHIFLVFSFCLCYVWLLLYLQDQIRNFWVSICLSFNQDIQKLCHSRPSRENFSNFVFLIFRAQDIKVLNWLEEGEQQTYLDNQWETSGKVDLAKWLASHFRIQHPPNGTI